MSSIIDCYIFNHFQQSMVNYIIHIIMHQNGFYPSTAMVSEDGDCWWGTCFLCVVFWRGVRGRGALTGPERY